MVEATKESSHHKKDEIKCASDALPEVERILDPCDDRKCKDVPKPPRFPLT